MNAGGGWETYLEVGEVGVTRSLLGIAANGSGGSSGRPQFEDVSAKAAYDEKGWRH
jgi:hypothetical protein